MQLFLDEGASLTQVGRKKRRGKKARGKHGFVAMLNKARTSQAKIAAQLRQPEKNTLGRQALNALKSGKEQHLEGTVFSDVRRRTQLFPKMKERLGDGLPGQRIAAPGEGSGDKLNVRDQLTLIRQMLQKLQSGKAQDGESGSMMEKLKEGGQQDLIAAGMPIDLARDIKALLEQTIQSPDGRQIPIDMEKLVGEIERKLLPLLPTEEGAIMLKQAALMDSGGKVNLMAGSQVLAHLKNGKVQLDEKAASLKGLVGGDLEMSDGLELASLDKGRLKTKPGLASDLKNGTKIGGLPTDGLAGRSGKDTVVGQTAKQKAGALIHPEMSEGTRPTRVGLNGTLFGRQLDEAIRKKIDSEGSGETGKSALKESLRAGVEKARRQADQPATGVTRNTNELEQPAMVTRVTNGLERASRQDKEASIGLDKTVKRPSLQEPVRQQHDNAPKTWVEYAAQNQKGDAEPIRQGGEQREKLTFELRRKPTDMGHERRDGGAHQGSSGDSSLARSAGEIPMSGASEEAALTGGPFGELLGEEVKIGDGSKTRETTRPAKQAITQSREKLQNLADPTQIRMDAVEKNDPITANQPKATQPLYRQMENGLYEAYVVRPKSVTVRLHPDELGEVRLQVAEEQEKLKAKIQTESKKVSALIRDHQAELEYQLREKGIEFDQIDVGEERQDRDEPRREQKREMAFGSSQDQPGHRNSEKGGNGMPGETAGGEGEVTESEAQSASATWAPEEGQPFSFTV